MWTTKQIISTIQDYMPEVSRERVKGYLTRAYFELMNTDSSQLVFYNRSAVDSSPTPILNVQTDVREYDLTTANLLDTDGSAIPLTVDGQTVYIRELRAAYIEASDLRYNDFGLETLGEYRPNDYPSTYNQWYRERTFVKIPIQFYPKSGQLPASILLFNDYTTDVYLELYYSPAPLGTENIQMLLDTDQWQKALIDGAVGYYEDVINGKSERLKKFEDKWIPKYKRYGTDYLMNKISKRFVRRPIG